MSRLDIEQLPNGVLTHEDYQKIELKAKSMGFDTCLELLGLEEEDIPKDELVWAKRVFRKGRAEGISEAGTCLFSSMKGRNGGSNALAYLRQMCSEFNVDQTPTGEGSGFVFNVVMPEEKSDT